MPGDGFRHDFSVGILAAVPKDYTDRCRSHPDLEAIRDHSLLEQSPVHNIPILARNRAQEQEVHCTQGLTFIRNLLSSHLGRKVSPRAFYQKQAHLVTQLMVHFHQVPRGTKLES